MLSKDKQNELKKRNAAIFAILSVYATGKDNARTAQFIADKLLNEYGYKINRDTLRSYILEHPAIAFDTRRGAGGYYIMTNPAEAEATAADLERRTLKMIERAEALRNYFKGKNK